MTVKFLTFYSLNPTETLRRCKVSAAQWCEVCYELWFGFRLCFGLSLGLSLGFGLGFGIVLAIVAVSRSNLESSLILFSESQYVVFFTFENRCVFSLSKL